MGSINKRIMVQAGPRKNKPLSEKRARGVAQVTDCLCLASMGPIKPQYYKKKSMPLPMYRAESLSSIPKYKKAVVYFTEKIYELITFTQA
jgi:hypothetical protein